MRIWSLEFRQGLRNLSRHNPQKAIQNFQKAIAQCPVNQRQELGRMLYFMGFALHRLGQGSLAVKSWVNARKLIRHGPILWEFDRWVNEYGMRRCQEPEADDYFAFQSIQVSRYLSKKKRGRFGSRAERDVVYELIADAWKTIRCSGLLTTMTTAEKLAIFKRARVDFPYLYVEDALDEGREPLYGNFRRGRVTKARLGPDDPCSCGSGLPWRLCCGRLSSCVEQESGSL